MDRRRFIEGFVASGAVAVTTTATAEATHRPPDDAPNHVDDPLPEVAREPERPAGPAEWAALAPYADGDPVALGWRVGGLSQVHLGAMVLTLVHADRATARVHLCARPRGSAGAGVAASRNLDFVLMNGGTGRASTDESVGRALLTLADRVARHEARAEAPPPVDGLLPHATRVRRFAHGRGLE